jgi:uncharacterized protein YggU (UPF0235/DUF167 family)
MITLTAHPDGCILPVRQQWKVGEEGVVGEQAGALLVAVSPPHESGSADEALIEAMCEVLGLKVSQVELLNGGPGSDKLCLIRGMTMEELRARVAALLAW